MGTARGSGARHGGLEQVRFSQRGRGGGPVCGNVDRINCT
jgi:hypothetical protein